MQSLVGTWLLTASLSIEGEISFVANRPDPAGVEDWLYGSSHELLAQATPAGGLILRIERDGNFTERRQGQPQVPWFDAEGVLDTEITTFDGVIRADGRVGYLLLATPIKWAIPKDRLRKTRMRYDDGDTVICDKVEPIDGRLIRTVSVISDALYLERTVLIYCKSGN
jgi:hypothetical protein